MNEKTGNGDSYHSLLLLEEISKEEPVSQRELSKRLGIALGLVNSYVKNMISRGYIRVKAFPKNRYNYLLTPKGIAEKTRLTYQHLHYFTNLYTTARTDFRELFHALEISGVKKLAFCGIDEVAEIAYLSLQETGIELIKVVDDDLVGNRFFNYTISPLEEITTCDFDMLVISSLKKKSFLLERLKDFRTKEEMICTIKGS